MKKFTTLLIRIIIFIALSLLYYFVIRKILFLLPISLQIQNVIEIFCIFIYAVILCPAIIILTKKIKLE